MVIIIMKLENHVYEIFWDYLHIPAILCLCLLLFVLPDDVIVNPIGLFVQPLELSRRTKDKRIKETERRKQIREIKPSKNPYSVHHDRYELLYVLAFLAKSRPRSDAKVCSVDSLSQIDWRARIRGDPIHEAPHLFLPDRPQRLNSRRAQELLRANLAQLSPVLAHRGVADVRGVVEHDLRHENARPICKDCVMSFQHLFGKLGGRDHHGLKLSKPYGHQRSIFFGQVSEAMMWQRATKLVHISYDW